MKLSDIQEPLNEGLLPATVISFMVKYAKPIISAALVIVIEKLLERMLKKFYINSQDNLPKDLFYMGVGYSMHVPKNEYSNVVQMGGLIRTELEKQMNSDFSLYQISDASKFINKAEEPPVEDKDTYKYALNSFLFGFRNKPNVKDLTMKLQKAFGRFDITIKITYYGKK